MREVSDFERKRHNKVLDGSETLRILGPKIWDLIPNDIKLASSLSIFKSLIKNGLFKAVLADLHRLTKLRIFMIFYCIH